MVGSSSGQLSVVFRKHLRVVFDLESDGTGSIISLTSNDFLPMRGQLAVARMRRDFPSPVLTRIGMGIVDTRSRRQRYSSLPGDEICMANRQTQPHRSGRDFSPEGPNES
jgi:hypothetical protein